MWRVVSGLIKIAENKHVVVIRWLKDEMKMNQSKDCSMKWYSLEILSLGSRQLKKFDVLQAPL